MCAEGKKTSDPAEAAEPGSSENIKPGRVRPRDDAPTAAGAKNPVSQTDGRPGAPGRPGSRPQPTGAAARTRGRRETEHTQGDQAEETGASGTDHAPARRSTAPGDFKSGPRGQRRTGNMLTHRTRAHDDGSRCRRPSHRHRPARGDRLPGSSRRAGPTAPGSPEPHGPPDSGQRPGPAGQGELGRTRPGNGGQPHGQPERQ